MDINDNLQQINTFVKGMNTDVSDMLMDSSQYRYAENVRLVTNTDSNSGELRLIEGTEAFFTENIPWKKIITMTSVRDYIVIIGETRYEPNKTISIFTNNTKSDAGWTCIAKDLPYEEFVQDGEEEPHFSTVLRWESDNNIKLYIADGIHTIICLNITQSYIKDGYTEITDLTPYSSAPLSAPQVEIVSGGQLKSARVLYAYRMYNLGEPATKMSPLSKIYSLYKGDNMGFHQEDPTDKAARISIESQLDFERILIYRITYVILGLVPLVDIVYDGDYISTFTDRGSSLSTITIEEFVSSLESLIVPKIIESKNDYLFAANLSYKQDQYDKQLDGLDFRSYSTGDLKVIHQAGEYASGEYIKEDMYSHNTLYDDREDHGNPKYNITKWLKPTDANRLSVGGDGPIVSWKYKIKKALFDENNTAYSSDTDFKEIEKGTLLSLKRGEVYRYGIILYSQEGVASSVKWVADIMIPDGDPDEYDPNSLYFPQDNVHGTGLSNKFTRPNLPTGYVDIGTYFSNIPYLANNKYGWIISLIGIEFSVDCRNIPNCSGYEIVRCKRSFADSFTLTQGIVGFTDKTDRNLITAPMFMTTQPILKAVLEHGLSAQYVEDKKHLLFASPEYAYQHDDIKELIEDNDSNLYLKTIQSYYHPTNEFPYAMQIKIMNGDDPVYTVRYKLFFGIISGTNVFKFRNDHSPIIWSTTVSGDGIRNVYTGPTLAVMSLGDLTDASTGEQFTGFIVSRDPAQGLNRIPETALSEICAAKEIDIPKHSITINAVGFPNVPKPDEFFSDSAVGTYRDALTTIGTTLYNSWCCFSDIARSRTNDEEFYNRYRDEDLLRTNPVEAMTLFAGASVWHPAGFAGRSMVLELANEYPSYDEDADGSVIAPITVCSIRKVSVPYNGPDSYLTNSPDYISYGNYRKIGDPDFNPITSVVAFDGDCYPGIFVYTAIHAFDNSVLINKNKITTIYYVPVESDIDLRATWGDIYTRVKDDPKSYYILEENGVIDGFTLENNQYEYNTAYNAEPDSVTVSLVEYTRIDHQQYDCRVHHSEIKTNGEHVDSWTLFKPMNFIDVDTRFGKLTNLRLFKDNMIFWLVSSSGILSINERTVLNDIDENNIVLGTGGVLLRYDYISTVYGMKPNQYEAEVQSNTTQYWWDGYNKEILAYSGNMSLLPLTKHKAVTNYINSREESKRPSLSYDQKYNELISNVVHKALNDEESIIYNEQVLAFTSIYNFGPVHRTKLNNVLLMSPLQKIFKWNTNKTSLSTLFLNNVFPKINYVVNKQSGYNKVFDITTFGGRFYGGGAEDIKPNDALDNLTFKFSTPLKQNSEGTGRQFITNREYDFRLAIPRNANSAYGDRMRGKTMQCELSSSSNSTDFSLQYIITKFRMSWS